jgi:hypothetical protein
MKMKILCRHYSREAGNRLHGLCRLGLHDGHPFAGQCFRCQSGRFVGSNLAWLLARIGFREQPGCECKAKAAEMDRRGLAWCVENQGRIESWIAQEAARRRVPYVAAVGRLLVKAAIRRARLHGMRTPPAAGVQPLGKR